VLRTFCADCALASALWGAESGEHQWLSLPAFPRVRLGNPGPVGPTRSSRLGSGWIGWEHPAANDSFAQSKKWLALCDVIYVAGGDTLRLLEALQGGAWRNSIAQALERGLLLVGVSAGASVWFDSALSDAGGQGLRPLKGLGLFRGSFCPHYQNEAERRPAFERAIARGHLPPGYGADDGAALWLTAEGPQAWRSARERACIWRVSAEQGSYPCFGAPEP